MGTNRIKYNLKNVHAAKQTVDAEGNYSYAVPRQFQGL